MKKPDYKAILSAVEQALAICDDASTIMDQTHQRICEELRKARKEILQALRASGAADTA